MNVVDEADQGYIYEPVRLVLNASPPKRFYRTFWRSAARRMLEREGMQKDKSLQSREQGDNKQE